MATVTKIVGASGSADYATISLWYNARYNQPATGDTEVCVLEDGDHDWNGYQGNWSAVDLTIRFEAQNSHGGVWSSGARIVPTGQLQIPNRNDDTTIEFIDLVFDFPSSFCVMTISNSSSTSRDTDITFTKCLCYNASTYAAIARQVGSSTGVTTVTATNCVLEGEGSSWFDLPYSISSQTDTYVVMTACTVRDTLITLQRHASNTSTNSSVVANGCLISIDSSMNGGQMVRFASNSYARGGSSVDCITTEAEATHDNWANNSRTNATYGVTFHIDGSAPASGEVSWEGGTPPKLDFSLVENANNLAIGYATNATMPSGDIEGNVRPASPDAGAYQSAVGVTLTPGVATVATSGKAPTASVSTALTPGVASLTTTTLAPGVIIPITISPGVVALATSGFAPSLVAADELTPGTAALSLATFAPGVPTYQTMTTCGDWSTPVTFGACDEWSLTLTGPSANAPQVRVQIQFVKQ